MNFYKKERVKLMSKIAICYFSYHKDEPFLYQSLRALENVIKYTPQHEIKVYIFDDANCVEKIDKTNISKLDFNNSLSFIETTFDRKGNLNGYDCINGIIQTYVKIYQNYQYDYIIKLDSDCVINNLDYINTVEMLARKQNCFEQVGQIGSMFAKLACYGCCQTFRPNAINVLKHLFDQMNGEIHEQAKVLKKRVELGFNEDKVVSILLEMSSLIRVNLDMVDGVVGHLNAFTCKNPNEDYTKYTSVAFKPNLFGDINWSRSESLEKMEKHVNELIKCQ